MAYLTRANIEDRRARFRIVKRLLLPVLLFAAGESTLAQDRSPAYPSSDSLRSYDLEEIVVTTGPEQPASSSTLQRVSIAGIARQNSPAIEKAARLIPAAHVQTNSRGETLIYLRNAGERQVAVFFDGALLNIPWDNRVDLSLVPSSVVGFMTVAKGVPSVVYGTNVLGGAVNLTSRATEGPYAELNASLGRPRSVQTSATYLRHGGQLSFGVSGGYADEQGDALPEGANLPFSQPGDQLRVNTDRKLTNLFGNASWTFSPRDAVGVSVLHISGEKGVAPESHIDPAAGQVRYWRYPTWQNTMMILNGSAGVGMSSRLRATLWGTRGRHDIAQFEDVSYDALRMRQENTDWVAGGRLLLYRDVFHGTVTLAGNALTSVHQQRDVPVDGNGRGQEFQQHVYSIGAETEQWLGRHTRLDIGASMDGVAMPRTGDKPAHDPFTDYSVRAGLLHQVSNQVHIRASAGRKVRFPTMRELFGEALARFELNPSLSPERSAAAEVGVGLATDGAEAELTAFIQRTYDTIDQTVVPNGKRMRINLDGSRVVGVETSARAHPADGWMLDGHATWMRTRAFAGGHEPPMAERPDLIAMLTAAYSAPWNLSFLGQVVYNGSVYSMAEDGSLVPLSASTELNAGMAYRIFWSTQQAVLSEIFMRVDNLTDEVIVRQLGLPSAGREFSAGLSVLF